MSCHLALVRLIAALLCVACSTDALEPTQPAGQPAVPSEPFPRERSLQVDLTVAESDWDLIRAEGRTLSATFSGCHDRTFEYTKVPARVVVDGRELAQVGLRKKGLLGSLSMYRPSLRVELDEYNAGQQLADTKVLILNNSRQDPSYTHQCMAYAVFQAAGVPAPRCGIAHVTLNGQALGSYVLVEAIKKPFLARAFGNDDGDLYEAAAGADFRTDLLPNFEKKTNEDAAIATQLTRLAAVLEGPDAGLGDRISELVDLDAFMRFWATEALVAHWDGYSGNLNNYFVYVNPNTEKLLFIPWGTDGAFNNDHGFLPEVGRPKSVYAWARLPHRLYALPDMRDRYRATLRSLLADHWDEQTLLEEVDRIAALAGDAATADSLEAQREFLRNRRAELLAELDAPAPSWPFNERATTSCRPENNTKLSGSFRTTWSELGMAAANPDNAFDVVVDGKRQSFDGVLASAGLQNAKRGSAPAVQLLAPLANATYLVVSLNIAAPGMKPGETALHGFETYGVLVQAPGAERFTMIGFIGDGRIVFDQAGMTPGAAIRGHFDATLSTLDPDFAALLSEP